jgi:hypothetical protein
MFCIKCGTQIIDGAGVCNRCGAKAIDKEMQIPIIQNDNINPSENSINPVPLPTHGSVPKLSTNPIVVPNRTNRKKMLIPIIACSCVIIITLAVAAYFLFHHNSVDTLRFISIEEFVNNWNRKVNDSGSGLPIFLSETLTIEDRNSRKISAVEYIHEEDQISYIFITGASDSLSIFAVLPTLYTTGLVEHFKDTLDIMNFGLSNKTINDYGTLYGSYIIESQENVVGFAIHLNYSDGDVSLRIIPRVVNTYGEGSYGAPIVIVE